jgi:hypothetical protein
VRIHRRHHAHDAVRLVVELHRAADHVRISGELGSPESVAQDDDVLATWRVLLLPKDASERRSALTTSKKPALTAVARTVRAVPVPVSASSAAAHRTSDGGRLAAEWACRPTISESPCSRADRVWCRRASTLRPETRRVLPKLFTSSAVHGVANASGSIAPLTRRSVRPASARSTCAPIIPVCAWKRLFSASMTSKLPATPRS